MHVLAVDDSERSLLILKNYLESFCFYVTLASNGREALSSARKANKDGKPISLVIVDWKMPQMDGIEIAHELRAMDELSIKPKVLLISNSSLHEMSPYLERNLVDGIMEKPLQKNKLFEAVAKVSGVNKLQTGKYRVTGAQFNMTLVDQVRGARLLLVEDNEINQQVAQELLQGFGVEVVIAENGVEAIVCLKEEKFDGVLMDMQMPEMDGITATREIRKNPQFGSLPIIALTANVYASEQNEFLAAGMNDHIGKPIDPDQLITVLAKWVRPMRTTESALPAQPVPANVTMPLPEIAGVKVAESVRRLGGKVALYYALLEKFRVSEHNAVTKIREALAAEDHKTAERLAHTLRGITGTLGAEKMQNLAELLENSIKNGSLETIESQLVQIEQDLASLIVSIDHALELRQS
jgi:CheY-like chemotaxis protein/HPt (histidine-containing phosphotransfer) domain-containing protein